VRNTVSRIVHKPGRRLSVASTVVVLGASLVAAGGGVSGASTVASAAKPKIVFMTIGSFTNPQISFPQVETAVQARVNAINATGGVNGRKLQVIFCDDQGDPNIASACARQAGQDHAAAVVGGASTQANSIFPVLTAENIPWVGSSGASGVIELTDPISFPIQGGAPAASIGLGHVLVKHGGTKPVIITISSAAAQNGAQQVLSGVIGAGGSGTIVTAPLSTVDFSAVVATALSNHPNAVALVVAPTQAASVVQSLRQAGYTGLIGAISTALSAPAVHQLGSAANGIFLMYRLIPTTQTKNPTVAQFVKEMKHQNASALVDETGFNGWTAVNFFAGIAARVPNLSGSRIISYLNHLTMPIPLTVLPAWGSLKAPAAFPRARNFVTIVGQVRKGSIVQVGTFYDPLK
jgi:ABC-type branched-subunit amino acid transport system substrate-binding protein